MLQAHLAVFGDEGGAQMLGEEEVEVARAHAGKTGQGGAAERVLGRRLHVLEHRKEAQMVHGMALGGRGAALRSVWVFRNQPQTRRSKAGPMRSAMSGCITPSDETRPPRVRRSPSMTKRAWRGVSPGNTSRSTAAYSQCTVKSRPASSPASARMWEPPEIPPTCIPARASDRRQVRISGKRHSDGLPPAPTSTASSPARREAAAGPGRR